MVRIWPILARFDHSISYLFSFILWLLQNIQEVIVMELNFAGELNIMIEKGIMPNFSDLSRRYKIDRKTIRKYYVSGGIPKRKHMKSWFDRYRDEIEWNYNSFKSYTRAHGISLRKFAVPHSAYETPSGEQLRIIPMSSISLAHPIGVKTFWRKQKNQKAKNTNHSNWGNFHWYHYWKLMFELY